MEEINDDFENNNFDNYEYDNDVDSLDDSDDDECTYARFDFESFDLDDFLRRLDSTTPNRKRNLYEGLFSHFIINISSIFHSTILYIKIIVQPIVKFPS